MKQPAQENQLKILKKALFLMGQHCRNVAANPSLETYFHDMELFKVLAGGGERDPEGKEFVYYFVDKAIKELGLEEE